MLINAKQAEFVKNVQAVTEQCAVSRVWFVENVLGAVPEKWQRRALEALDAGETRISIRSGNGVGKTTFCAWTALHYLLFRNDVKIPVTSPGASQMKDGMIPEVKKWIAKLPDVYKDMLDSTADRIVRVDSPENNFISFRTARRETPEVLAGIHATYVLVVVDEASGVEEAIYEAAQGTLSTAGAIFILIGNPTRLSGYFYNTHHKLKKRWWTIHLSSFDSSRVDHDFVQTIVDTYGLDSNQYRIKVLGEFGTGEDKALINRSTASAAINRDILQFGNNYVWGLDPGRGGDPSALVVRNHNVVDRILEWSTKDTTLSVGVVVGLWNETPEAEKPSSILVDSVGLGGPIADRLRELGLPAIDINVGESSSMKNKYLRMRDELWYMTKEWFESMVVSIRVSDTLPLLLAEKLVEEVSSPLELMLVSGKNAVEQKEMMKKRFIQSPNIADALCLTFAFNNGISSGRASGRASSKPLPYRPPSVR